MNLRPRRTLDASIDLTPLIDILFIVLLFLVLTTTFRAPTRLRVDLPEATTGVRPHPRPAGDLRVTVTEEGQLHVAERAVTLEELAAFFSVRPSPEEVVLLLSADDGADHGRVVAVMDLARRSGIPRIDIETLHAPTAP